MINLVDTAGIRRKSRVEGKLEKLAVGDSLRSIQYAEVVVLLLDATIPFEKQDLQLADLVEREGRALVIAVNKWDLIEDKNKALADLREECERLLPQLRGVPLVTISGLQGRNIDRLMEAIFDDRAGLEQPHLDRRSSTAGWRGMIESHPPPAVSGRRLKLRYMTQAKIRPPSFILFASRPDALPAAYLRYLVNGMREDLRHARHADPALGARRQEPVRRPRQSQAQAELTALADADGIRDWLFAIWRPSRYKRSAPKRPDAECGAAATCAPLIVEILIVVVLTLVNGAARDVRTGGGLRRGRRASRSWRAEGNKGADVALKLAEDPGKFLSSVQIGITLVGVLSGAFSGATLGARLARWLESRGRRRRHRRCRWASASSSSSSPICR